MSASATPFLRPFPPCDDYPNSSQFWLLDRSFRRSISDSCFADGAMLVLVPDVNICVPTALLSFTMSVYFNPIRRTDAVQTSNAVLVKGGAEGLIREHGRSNIDFQ